MNPRATEILVRLDPETGETRAVEYVDVDGRTVAAERREAPKGQGRQHVIRGGRPSDSDTKSVAALSCTWYCIPDGNGGCYWVCV